LICHANFDFQGFASHVLLRQDHLKRLDPVQNLYSPKACHSLALFELHFANNLLRNLVIDHKLLPQLGFTGAKQPLNI
jgi:hypothetical protein